MYDSRTVANEFLKLAEAEGATLTPMQLLKLVYLAHGWSLALLGRPLINDRVEAWQYGPVIPKLYSAIREFRSNPVVGPILGSKREELGREEKSIISQVYKTYGRLSGPALSRLTHEPMSPWARTYTDGSFGLQISNDLIEDHYARLVAKDRKPAA